MIQNIIFDMGQVLIRWDPLAMLRAFPLSQEETALINRELFQSIEWVQQDHGTLDEAEVVAKVCARLPEKLHPTVQQLVYRWHQQFLNPIPGMADLVRELKGEGYRIFLLSNAGTSLRTYFHRIPGSECFDQLMVSAEEKLLKPSHEIYERLYEKFQLNPAECWFIDDNPSNIEGAFCTGMNGTVFRGDATMLRKALHEAGIRCKGEME